MNPASRSLVIGTRGSDLALAQVKLLIDALLAAGVEARVEVKKIRTSGDRRSEFADVKETGAGVKGLFTREIEMALADGQIDVAVHSCKDLPGQITPGLSVCAVLPREDTADVFIGRELGFDELPEGALVATSSVRRKRQLTLLRPSLVVEELRGNVPTRIGKLRAFKTCAGIVLARAGLNRLGIDLSDFRVSELPILPAIGQGAIALQCRAGDDEAASILARVNHAATFACVRAERELLRLLNGDCHLPVGARTRLEGGSLSMEAVVFGEEGDPPRTAQGSGVATNPEAIAATVFARLTWHLKSADSCSVSPD